MTFTYITLTAAEEKQLDTIRAAFNHHFQIDVKTHIQNAGKTQQLVQAILPGEIADQKDCFKRTLRNQDASLAATRMIDIFTNVARRVEADTVLASHISAVHHFTPSDIQLLDKCKLDGLSALAKLRP